jgi:hypothetical protein
LVKAKPRIVAQGALCGIEECVRSGARGTSVAHLRQTGDGRVELRGALTDRQPTRSIEQCAEQVVNVLTDVLGLRLNPTFPPQLLFAAPCANRVCIRACPPVAPLSHLASAYVCQRPITMIQGTCHHA